MVRCPLALVCLSVVGCAGSFSNHLTPRPTKPGQVDLGAAVGATGTIRGATNRVAVVSNPELRLRVGITDGIDLGGKIHMLGGEISSRIRLLEGTIDLAVVPAIGGVFSTFTEDETESVVFSVKLPLLAGFNLGDHFTIVAGPAFLLHASADGDVILYPGGTLGVNIQFVPLVAIFPEVNVFVPYHVDLERWRKPILQAGLGLRVTLGAD